MARSYNKLLCNTALYVFGGLFSCIVIAKSVDATDEASRAEIAERIEPFGSVCIKGVECEAHKGQALTISTGKDVARSGKTVFDSYCMACHSTGVLGAPKKGDSAAWKVRFTEAGSFDVLLSNAINGIRNMPPKGTCMDCADDEISQAIQFMSGYKP